MSPEDKKRVERLLQWHTGTETCDPGCHLCFLLRVISKQGKEIEQRTFGLNSVIILAGHDPDHPDHERLSEIQSVATVARDGVSKGEMLQGVFLKGSG